MSLVGDGEGPVDSVWLEFSRVGTGISEEVNGSCIDGSGGGAFTSSDMVSIRVLFVGSNSKEDKSIEKRKQGIYHLLVRQIAK